MATQTYFRAGRFLRKSLKKLASAEGIEPHPTDLRGIAERATPFVKTLVSRIS
jgi:hypothetical protein